MMLKRFYVLLHLICIRKSVILVKVYYTGWQNKNEMMEATTVTIDMTAGLGGCTFLNNL